MDATFAVTTTGGCVTTSLHVAYASECQLGSVCSLRARVVR